VRSGYRRKPGARQPGALQPGATAERGLIAERGWYGAVYARL